MIETDELYLIHVIIVSYFHCNQVIDWKLPILGKCGVYAPSITKVGNKGVNTNLQKTQPCLLYTSCCSDLLIRLYWVYGGFLVRNSFELHAIGEEKCE